MCYPPAVLIFVCGRGNGVVFLCDCGSVWVTIRHSWQGLIFDPFEPLIGGQGDSGRRSCLHCVDDRDSG